MFSNVEIKKISNGIYPFYKTKNRVFLKTLSTGVSTLNNWGDFEVIKNSSPNC